MIWLISSICVVLLAVIVANIRIVAQSKAFVIERLGKYCATWQVGIHIKIPLIDRIANRMSLKEKVLDFPPQPVIQWRQDILITHLTRLRRTLCLISYMQ